jgi:hypothetical protein
VLLVVALVEVAVNRVAVPMLRVQEDPVPLWHEVLDYTGLYLYYFVALLAVLVLVTRAVSRLFYSPRNTPDARVHVHVMIVDALVGVTALLACVPILIPVPQLWAYVLETAFALSLIALATTVMGSTRDLGVQVGIPILIAPLLFHTYTFYVKVTEYPDGVFFTPGAPGEDYTKIAVVMLSLAALATPYCFAPRPFARSVARPIPIVIAMGVAAVGAIAARLWYKDLAKSVDFAIACVSREIDRRYCVTGQMLDAEVPDQKLALYLLAIATLIWTLAACGLAGTQARRTIGAGIALIVLGGYDFEFPHHF